MAEKQYFSDAAFESAFGFSPGDANKYTSSSPYTSPSAPTTQQLTQAERDALAALSPAELEALKQFNATATEEQKAMLRRMADGSAPAADAEPVTSGSGDGSTNILENEEILALQEEQEALNALEIIKEELALYGLEGLADQAYNMLLDGIGPQAVLLRLRQTPEFAARFPGLDLRRANGFSAISPAEYINLERQYRNVMMTAGSTTRLMTSHSLLATTFLKLR
jgi:hypothetical protein